MRVGNPWRGGKRVEGGEKGGSARPCCDPRRVPPPSRLKPLGAVLSGGDGWPRRGAETWRQRLGLCWAISIKKGLGERRAGVGVRSHRGAEVTYGC